MQIIRNTEFLKKLVYSFTPLEKVHPVRKILSNGVKERSSLMGFTLVELIIVIIIIGILSFLGMPMYIRAMEGSRNKEAKSQLSLIAEAERMHWLEERNYITCNDISDCNDKLHLNLPQGSSWDYTVSSSGASSFSAQAVRKEADNRVWTINESLNLSCNNAAYCKY